MKYDKFLMKMLYNHGWRKWPLNKSLPMKFPCSQMAETVVLWRRFTFRELYWCCDNFCDFLVLVPDFSRNPTRGRMTDPWKTCIMNVIMECFRRQRRWYGVAFHLMSVLWCRVSVLSLLAIAGFGFPFYLYMIFLIL